jgi:hypothetical protein
LGRVDEALLWLGGVVIFDLCKRSHTFYPPNTAANQPATGWFLFQNILLNIKKCVSCYDTVILMSKMYSLN